MRSQHGAFNKVLCGTALRNGGEFRGRPAPAFLLNIWRQMPGCGPAESISVGRRCPDDGDCG
jgi:hypothetical protein